MLDLLIKLLIVMFTFSVGGCFALWPEEVTRQIDRCPASSVETAEDRWRDVRKRAVVSALRPMGVFLVGLACYLFYLEWLAR